MCKELSAEVYYGTMSFGLITMCTYFGSLLLDSVSGTRKKKIALKDAQRIKAVSGSEATVVSYELYKEENSAIFGGADCI